MKKSMKFNFIPIALITFLERLENMENVVSVISEIDFYIDFYIHNMLKHICLNKECN